MHVETVEAGISMLYRTHQNLQDETNETIIQVMQSTLIINTNTTNHTGNTIESKSTSKRRRQTDQEANLGVHRYAHALVAAVAPGVSLDLTLHETQLQAVRYA